MRGSRLFLGMVVLCGTLALAGCRTTRLENVESMPYGGTGLSNTTQLSMAQIESAIVRAGTRRGWVFSGAGPGHLVGNVDVRGKHHATVDVFYDQSDFSILYKDSQNLNYDASTKQIHPNYNSWVRLLADEIRAEITAARQT